MIFLKHYQWWSSPAFSTITNLLFLGFMIFHNLANIFRLINKTLFGTTSPGPLLLRLCWVRFCTFKRDCMIYAPLIDCCCLLGGWALIFFLKGGQRRLTCPHVGFQPWVGRHIDFVCLKGRRESWVLSCLPKFHRAFFIPIDLCVIFSY